MDIEQVKKDIAEFKHNVNHLSDERVEYEDDLGKHHIHILQEPSIEKSIVISLMKMVKTVGAIIDDIEGFASTEDIKEEVVELETYYSIDDLFDAIAKVLPDYLEEHDIT